MPKKPGTKLRALKPQEWIDALRKLGVEPIPGKDRPPHVQYEVPGYRDRRPLGQPYVVDTNWQAIPRQDIRLILKQLGIPEEKLWEVL